MRRGLLPPGATRDAGILLAARAIRGFGDGFVSVLLPLYLTLRGLDSLRVGTVATATLVGSAALTLLVGLVAYRLQRRRLLLRVALLMAATGLGFALARDFWALLVVAFVGTLNPSSGDVSVFLPTEQALLPQTAPARERTALFARYSLVGSLVAAVGALGAGLPQFVADRSGLGLARALEGMFVLYAVLGLGVYLLYRGLSPAIEPDGPGEGAPAAPLGRSRGIVYRMAAVFSLDSFGGGFVVQSLLALWLFQRFELSVTTAGTIFFWTGGLSSVSYLVAVPLARRFGLLNTLNWTQTHAPCRAARGHRPRIAGDGRPGRASSSGGAYAGNRASRSSSGCRSWPPRSPATPPVPRAQVSTHATRPAARGWPRDPLPGVASASPRCSGATAAA